jgi:hypothetical protein
MLIEMLISVDELAMGASLSQRMTKGDTGTSI